MERGPTGDAINYGRNSLAWLLHDNYELVFRYLVKITMDKNIAEEITQETMVRAIERYELYDAAKAKFSTWLIAIAHNIYMDSIRRRKREFAHVETEIQLDELYDFQQEHDDDWDLTLKALSKLPEEGRASLVMKHYYGYSLDEIAKIMAVPLGTVKSRIFNAIKFVRRELSI